MREGLEVEPLRITCNLATSICLPERQLALDGLLAWAVVLRTEQPPALSPQDCAHVEIPVLREPAQRFHLASFAEFTIERRTASYTNRRFPIAEAQTMGDPKTVRRILTTGGTTKSFRIPREEIHLAGPLTWYALANRPLLEELLALITYLGKKRSAGLGRIVPGSWRVERFTPWDEGFPVVRAGQPTRTLPLDWPGLTAFESGYRTLTYPYRKQFEQPCAAPLVEA